MDIRDRDINARALYDPRYDEKPSVTRARRLQIKQSAQQTPTTTETPVQPPTEPAAQPASQTIVQPPVKPAPQTTVQPPVKRGPLEVIPFVDKVTPKPLMINEPGFQPTSVTPGSTQTTRQSNLGRRIVTGDSIATGIGHGGARGTDESEAQWGRQPITQLQYMVRKGKNYYKGANVTLSSGLLNNPSDVASVEQQIQFLLDSKVKSIRLVGGPNSGYYATVTSKLQKLAEKYGIEFMGAYDPVSDRDPHPRTYNGYK